MLSLFLTASLLSCSEDQLRRPNILFVISDDQSWLHTSYAGATQLSTPGFDRIAREGLYFEHAYTNAASCAPSRASILTGQKFWRLEEGGLLFGRLKKDYPVFTRLLADAGYAVAATGKTYAPARQDFASTYPVSARETGLFDTTFFQKIETPPFIHGGDYAEAFIQFFDNKPTQQPFFFWMGPFEPHRAYQYGIGAEHGIDPDRVEVPPFLPDTDSVRNDIADYYFEIQWQDQMLERVLDYLEGKGELEHTLVVVTSDNGMPFPRAKATAYNYGVHMPLAIRWGASTSGGRKIKDFVNHEDFAPTFLDAAGIPVPSVMSGRSFLDILESKEEGWIDSTRNYTTVGLERHVWARPGGANYGRRAIYTEEWAYIRNYHPDRWPMGDPDFVASHQGIHGDIDDGPSKQYFLAHQKNSLIAPLFALSFGKLPANELYDLRKDPAQLQNLAALPEYQQTLQKLQQQLDADLQKTADPRMEGRDPWTDYPFYAGTTYLRGPYKEEVELLQ